MELPRPRGRPPGPEYTASIFLRLREADLADLKKLAEDWRVTDAAALRRLIREAARKLK